MALLPLNIPAGVYKNGTDLQATGRWADSNLVRWHDDSLQPVKGWRAKSGRGFAYPLRGLLGWKSNTGSRYLATGDYKNLFVVLPNDSVFDITPTGFTSGRVSASGMTGYGAGFYGQGIYNAPPISTSSVLEDATSWSLNAWGQNLIASTKDDGKIYEWVLNTSNPASLLSNAPTSIVATIVSDERFLFAFQTRTVYWSDQENNNVWTSTATNQAGNITLETQGSIKTAEKIKGGIIILTDEDAHTSTYIGLPFVHSIQRVGSKCGIFSKQSSVSIDIGVVWMGDSGFHIYSGGRVQELKCDVADHVYGEINMAQKSKVCAVANSKYDEIIWYYPVATENDRYVAWNYKNNTWSIGQIGRTTGIDSGTFEFPIHASSEFHTSNIGRGRFTIPVTFNNTPADKDGASDDVNNYVTQMHDITGMNGNGTFGTGVFTKSLMSTATNNINVVSLGYLSKLENGSSTEYETVVFPAQRLLYRVQNIGGTNSLPDYIFTVTGLDANGVVATDSYGIHANGTFYTTTTWTKVTNIELSRHASQSAFPYYTFGVGLETYGTPSYAQIKNQYNGITTSGIDVNTVIDAEITAGTFIKDGLVKFVASATGTPHSLGTDNTIQLFTRNKEFLTPNQYMLLEHEVGESRDGNVPYAETGAIQLGNGDRLMKVNKLIPDERTQGQVTATFKTRLYPNGTETDQGTFTLTNPTSVRFQGREIRMKVNNVSGDWRVGIMRLNTMNGGTR
jgi:hypothetical protein